MRFRAKGIRDNSLEVSLVQSERDDDVDIVVTDKKGNSETVAYLNEYGLTICEIGSDSELDIDLNGDGHITYQID
jgi:hypothetical protein